MNYLYLLGRSVFTYVFMLFIMRILGKKEVGQLNLFDLVVILIIADISSVGIFEGENFIYGIIALVVLVVMQKIISYVVLNFKKVRFFIDGNPAIVVMDGRVMYDVMKKEKYTIDDLLCQMRENSIMELSEVKLAILETNGTLSVFSKRRYNDVFLSVIISGSIEKEILKYLDIDESKVLEWLFNKRLKLEEVVHASSNGKELIITEILCGNKDK